MISINWPLTFLISFKTSSFFHGTPWMPNAAHAFLSAGLHTRPASSPFSASQDFAYHLTGLWRRSLLFSLPQSKTMATRHNQWPWQVFS